MTFYLDASAYSQAKSKWQGSISPYGCGEDSFFIVKKDGKSTCIGIADGVSQWNDFGYNPAFIAREMMLKSHFLHQQERKKNGGVTMSPHELMTQAYKLVCDADNIKGGSTTCCILSLQEQTGIVKSANIGDSGYIIVRNGNIVATTVLYKSLYNDAKRQLQLGIIPKNLRNIGNFFAQTNTKGAEIQEYIVEEGDVIVLGTDGLWDNILQASMDDTSFSQLTKESKEAFGKKNMQDLSELVWKLVHKREVLIPHVAQKLVKMALSYYTKPDDITVVVAKVCKSL